MRGTAAILSTVASIVSRELTKPRSECRPRRCKTCKTTQGGSCSTWSVAHGCVRPCAERRTPDRNGTAPRHSYSFLSPPPPPTSHSPLLHDTGKNVSATIHSGSIHDQDTIIGIAVSTKSRSIVRSFTRYNWRRRKDRRRDVFRACNGAAAATFFSRFSVVSKSLPSRGDSTLAG